LTCSTTALRLEAAWKGGWVNSITKCTIVRKMSPWMLALD